MSKIKVNQLETLDGSVTVNVSALAPASAGTTEQYWRGDKNWHDFFTDVRAATLTGLSTATNATVAATDTVLAAIGKLQAQVSAKFGKTGGDVDGNINFTGAGRRITGDFSNAAIGDRLMLQTNVADGPTAVEAIPNGSGGTSQFSASTSSDPNNASSLQLRVGLDTGDARISSTKRGTGAYLPLAFHAGGTERLRIDSTTGSVLATSGALGYGAGAGGSVSQGTSKGNGVVLNKPSGVITTHNSVLAGNTAAAFVVTNSFVSFTDTVVCNVVGGTGDVNAYIATAFPYHGGFYISLRNMTSNNLTDNVQIRFNTIKGSAS